LPGSGQSMTPPAQGREHLSDESGPHGK
jgi:hypothetical protein